MSGPRATHIVDEATELLSRALVALAPYSGKLVLAGGLVPIFYRRMPRFRPPDYSAAATKDIDIALPRNLRQIGATTIPEALLAAGIQRVTVPSLRLGEPDVEYFQDQANGTTRLAEVYIEFLSPRRDNDGTTVALQAGLRVQSLRDLGILFHEPLKLDLASLPTVEGALGTLPLARPVMLILQKVRARAERTAQKRDSDMAAIYDVALLSQPMWPDERASLERLVQQGPPWQGIVKHAMVDLEALLNDQDAIIGAVRVACGSGATVTETQVVRVLRAFIRAVG